MPGALDGIKVLDLSRVLAGPWATMTLGDLGAEVWKVENPGTGDDTRTWAPPAAGGVATYYLAANRNKKSLAVDLTTPEGREIIAGLAAQADIVIENFRPASLRKFKLTYEDLRAINPRLIYCSISGYGRGHAQEDRPGYDFVIQAESGFMAITGEPEGEPMKLGVAFVDLVSGMNAVQAILAALYMRERTGQGQAIDIALMDGALFLLANVASAHLNTGSEARRFGNAHPSIVPYQIFACADGRLALAVGNDEQYRRLCVHVLGAPELAADPRFLTNRGRAENRAALLPPLAAKIAGFALADILDRLHRSGIPAGKVHAVSEAFASETAQLRGSVVETPHPALGSFRSVASPLRLSQAPPSVRAVPPGLGEHTDAVLAEVLGYAPERIAVLRQAGIVA
ncbi:crotonobetainyl-CoA:carnitine CoA-transferase CaiB-like acyl-CoA transferase [Ancylobacter sp. 3268]|uniref:CaiB/BaiF CoA transferase family protein n=1 Tax=Ancylobacter sp. 3268 TaxID=2817752 RepID=UPI0028561E40|nr:CaiB/BaiF CoA-transferase family protein [Ancylobacter sp. 3268]MDR6952505.1 crotonobetainyl-CoA:carnitine CoA-transferase CaiB-like acyl-CoA transferase [Ancylobacter sp. 3268]